MIGSCVRHALGALRSLQGNRFRQAARVRFRALWREYGWTGFTQIVVMAAHLIAVRIGVQLFGAAGYGEYSIARRTASLICFPLLVGMGISLPRYIASVAQGPKAAVLVGSYALGAAFVTVLVLPLASVLIVALGGFWSPLVFGAAGFERFALPISLMSAGLYVQTLVYAYYRGNLAMNTANWFHGITSAAVPLIALAIARNNPAQSIGLTGAGWLLVAGGFVMATLLRSRHRVAGPRPDWRLVRQSARQMVIYGLPRVPGEVGWFGFLAVPVVVVGRQAGMATAGYFSAALSVTQLISGLFAFLSVLLLPRVAGLLSAERVSAAVRLVRRTVVTVASASVALALVLVLAAGLWVPYLLDSRASEALAIGRLCCLAGVPLAVYVVLRSPIDAASAFPYNAINLLLSLGIIVGLLIVLPDVVPAAAVLWGSAVLAVFSWLAWVRLAQREERRVRVP